MSITIIPLKTDSAHWTDVFDNRKRFELRKDDRPFTIGAILLLRETKNTGEQMAGGAPLKYTGRNCVRYVTHITRGPCYGINAGWAIMSVRPLTKMEKLELPLRGIEE